MTDWTPICHAPAGDLLVTDGTNVAVAYRRRGHLWHGVQTYHWQPPLRYARALDWAPTHFQKISPLPSPNCAPGGTGK